MPRGSFFARNGFEGDFLRHSLDDDGWEEGDSDRYGRPLVVETFGKGTPYELSVYIRGDNSGRQLPNDQGPIETIVWRNPLGDVAAVLTDISVSTSAFIGGAT